MIKAIEFARQKSYKEAIHEISKQLNTDDCQRQAILIIQQMLNAYTEYSSSSIMDFYELIKTTTSFQLPRFQSRSDGPTLAESFYRGTKYSDLALLIKNQEKVGCDRTIHQAKGSEFKNVLVVVKPKPNTNYDENRDLGFLLNPDINNEEHRVYYVAVSRAQENLYLYIPSLSVTAAGRLDGVCEIKYL
ncbi:3'-5' exonuclease [Paenibacillus catalpae]|uniref:3'-5' exonuclease n=1 Tax=Paenibacillus catalpae TaxID=1045775 RepID=UPI00158755B0|nr:3'-5' exonuclease [Paenibacillus catalpae]